MGKANNYSQGTHKNEFYITICARNGITSETTNPHARDVQSISRMRKKSNIVHNAL